MKELVRPRSPCTQPTLRIKGKIIQDLFIFFKKRKKWLPILLRLPVCCSSLIVRPIHICRRTVRILERRKKEGRKTIAFNSPDIEADRQGGNGCKQKGRKEEKKEKRCCAGEQTHTLRRLQSMQRIRQSLKHTVERSLCSSPGCCCCCCSR